MSRGFGIGAKLLLAFGGAFALAIVIAATGWLGFERIASSQRSVIGNAIPTMREAQQLAEINAAIVASSGRLARSTSDADRAAVNEFLSVESRRLLDLVEAFRQRGFESGDMESLSRVVNEIRGNLIEENELVRRRIHLQDRAAAISGELIRAADELTELSESLVANSASSATATSAGLYDLMEVAASKERVYTALDRLVEVDLDGMERMFELRLRSARVASFVAQLNRETRPGQISELESGLANNLEILRRRLADINDPGRKAQAVALLDSVIDATRRDNPESLFNLRIEALGTMHEIDRLVALNATLARELTATVSRLVDWSGRIIDRSSARAEESLRSSRVAFLWIALGTTAAVLAMFWLFLQRDVIRRLRALESTTRAIARGDLSRSADLKGADELSSMASALNVFRDNALEKRRLERELVEHQQHLERLVGERTRQLEETNAQLAESVAQHAAARERAEQANRAKTTFLATMSHELRTPVGGMLGVTQLLEESAPEGSRREYIHALRTAGNSLLNIVNDILDMSKLESGGVRLEDRPFNPETMALDLIALMRSPATDKGLDLAYAIDPDIDPTVVGDEDRVRQVLTNLLNNAIKFTDEGSVELSLDRVESARGGHCTIRFTISDTGIGIPVEMQENVFEPFIQVDSSVARRQGGTGLGLAICRRLVRAMGGRIDVHSEPGAFARFMVEIPFRTAAQSLADADPGDAPAPELEPLDVLLVEDDPVNRMVTRRYLENAGHRVREATSGIEALRVLDREARPGLVLMDIGLPGMDGVETARRIRGHPQPGLSGLPIVAMSAHVFHDEIDEYLEAGMNAYLGKPFTPRQLMETLAVALRDESRGVSVPDPASGDLIVNSSQLKQDFDTLGEEAMGEIIDLFVVSSRKSLDEYVAACKTRDFPRAGAAVHRLKSSAGSIGLDALRAESARVEEACANARGLSGQPETLVRLVERSRSLLLDNWSELTRRAGDGEARRGAA